MAENEAKARKKLEDAEKKAKGGGGFFSGLFGNAKAEEAADLFVQEDSETVLVCEENGCGMGFDDLASFEYHYERSHRHQCAICGRQFSNIHCLEIHADENHCSIFKIKRDRNPSIALFRCYEASCSQAFANPGERNCHSEKIHNIRGPSQSMEKRKLPQKQFAISQINKVTTPPHLCPRTPRAVVFGNLFKISKLWKEAGDAFVRSAEIHAAATDRKHDAASNYAEAANCYRKVNPQLAIDCLMKTAETYTDMGRFNMAAKYHCTMAEIFESEAPDMAQAMAHYQEAADFYKGEESRSSATKCMIKVAQYAAQLDDYKRAIKIFEEVATWEADHPTLKYAAKNHFFQALLCYLCSDLLDTQNALKRYEEISPSFVDSREYKLLNIIVQFLTVVSSELISCLEDKNQAKFTEVVKSFDKISRLDQWHTSLLVKIKRSCGDEDDDDLKLEEQYKIMKNRNEELEDRLLNLVEKVEQERIIFSSEIDQLLGPTILFDFQARYKKDCILAVNLLHCEPSKYIQQEKAPDVLSKELPQKNITVVRSIATFPPMAAYFPDDTYLEPDEPALRENQEQMASLTVPSNFTSEFVKKIKNDEHYSYVDLKRCPKCDTVQVAVSRETQTIELQAPWPRIINSPARYHTEFTI
uniref:C2H2-type domain-containing protein n=1 Tax=Setaria digitata TaxID=48799 RepID=A0A915PQH9_9BILA